MEIRKALGTPRMAAVLVMVLLILALPTWSLAQQADSSEGFLTSVYNMLFVWPQYRNIDSFDQIAGAKDHYTSDRGYSGSGYEHLPFEEEALRQLAKMRSPFDIPTPKGDALRKRAAAARAKRELKMAQKHAQHEKRTIDSQAAQKTADGLTNGCFPYDMQVVMSDGTTRSIAEVKPGDVVLTYDIGYDQIVGKPVVATYVVQSNHLYTVNGGLKTTATERVLTQSGWKPLIALTEQDQVHVNGQMMDIDTIAYQRMELTTYNLQVGDTHNFYVKTGSGDTYLIHNCGGGGGK
jgi:hypothetical protein